MKQVIVELDDETVRRLERAAPARSRRRSEFIRLAVQRALDAIEEVRMAAAYRGKPDDEAAHFDPAVWEPAGSKRRRGGARAPRVPARVARSRTGKRR